MTDTQNWQNVASAADIGDGDVIGVEIGGYNLAVFHVDGAWYCTDNVCTHQYALLCEGWLDGHLIECPLHAGLFDIRTGKGQGSPIDSDLRTFAVRIEGGQVQVALP